MAQRRKGVRLLRMGEGEMRRRGERNLRKSAESAGNKTDNINS
jgi:hypothetical protein